MEILRIRNKHLKPKYGIICDKCDSVFICNQTEIQCERVHCPNCHTSINVDNNECVKILLNSKDVTIFKSIYSENRGKVDESQYN